MKHVSRLWLRRFQFVLVALDVFVLGVYLYNRFTGGEAQTSHIGVDASSHALAADGIVWGINAWAVGLAVFHALYTACVMWWLDRYYTWTAHAIATLCSGGLLLVLANSDSSLHLGYHVLLMAFMFFATMTGTLTTGIILSGAFVSLIVSSLAPGHLEADPAEHAIEMILVSLSALVASTGWFVFSKRFVQNLDTKAVETLTGLVKQERNTVNLILESITDGVMIIDTNGSVQILNASSAKMLGWPREEAQNLPYDALLQPAAGTDAKPGATKEVTPKDIPAISQTLKTGEPHQQVGLMKTRDNRQIYIDISASPILREESGAKRAVGVIAVLRDVDKQKRDEQQRSEFISTASHEMRTPVAAIEGYLALALNNKVSTIDEKARSYIEKAHSSTQHLGKLFQDLLTSAKAEDNRLVSHPVVVEMSSFLEQVTDSLRFSAEKKGLLVDFTIGTSDPQDPNSLMQGKVIKPLYHVLGDPDRMREVLTNLFDNAVKYTESGKISIGLTGNSEVVQMFIRDTGPGIPAADIPHLFQKFYRVDNSATRTIGGTGLGLFICRKIVELYKGRVWVESQLGKGSTFYINLPRLSTQKAQELQKAEADQATNASPLDKS